MCGIGLGGSKEGVGLCVGGFGQGGWVLLWIVVFVDQQCVDVFGEIIMGGVMQGDDVFQVVDCGQILVGIVVLQFVC